MLRDIQVKIAEGNPRAAWVNTADLNSGKSRKGKMYKDDLHMSAAGYKNLGKRFAEAALKLIKEK